MQYNYSINYTNDQYLLIFNETFHKPEGAAYYAMYSIFTLIGIVGNSVLLKVVKQKIGFFGGRPTFTLLVEVLAILDIILSAMIPVDMTLITILPMAHQYEYFIHPRNIVLIFESYVLVLIAFDRYLAIRRPFSQSWNLTTLRRLILVLFSGTALLDMLDLVHKVVLPLWNIVPSILGYMIGITITLFATMLANYIIYFMVFLAHYNYTRQKNKLILTKPQKKQIGAGSSGMMEEIYLISTEKKHSPVDNNKSTTSDDSAADNEEKNPLTKVESFGSASNSVVTGNKLKTSINRRQRKKSSIRLARVFLCVTSVYTVSLVPHFLAGWQIIPFPGYIVYHSFYLNCFVNPIIYLANDAKIRQLVFGRIFRN